MTDQECEAIALALRNARDTADTAPGTRADQALVQYGVDQASRCIAAALLANNHRFDADRFLAAAGERSA